MNLWQYLCYNRTCHTWQSLVQCARESVLTCCAYAWRLALEWLEKLVRHFKAACIHTHYLTCKSKARREHTHTENHTKASNSILFLLSKPTPAAAQAEPTKLTHKNAHNHTLTQTVHTMPSFSHTLQSHCTAFQAAFLFVQSCLWDWAPLPFSHSAAAQWLLFGGTGCAHITSLTDRPHKDTATTACSIYASHSIHPPIHHLFVDQCFHRGLTSCDLIHAFLVVALSFVRTLTCKLDLKYDLYYRL